MKFHREFHCNLDYYEILDLDVQQVAVHSLVFSWRCYVSASNWRFVGIVQSLLSKCHSFHFESVCLLFFISPIALRMNVKCAWNLPQSWTNCAEFRRIPHTIFAQTALAKFHLFIFFVMKIVELRISKKIHLFVKIRFYLLLL